MGPIDLSNLVWFLAVCFVAVFLLGGGVGALLF